MSASSGSVQGAAKRKVEVMLIDTNNDSKALADGADASTSGRRMKIKGSFQPSETIKHAVETFRTDVDAGMYAGSLKEILHGKELRLMDPDDHDVEDLLGMSHSDTPPNNHPSHPLLCTMIAKHLHSAHRQRI